MTISQNFDLKAELAKCKTAEDLTGKNGLLQRLLGGMLEQLLHNEMDEHLGYEKHAPSGEHSGNSRNGTSKKTLKSSYGNVELEIPRDRNGDCEPAVVKKHQRSIRIVFPKVDIQLCIIHMIRNSLKYIPPHQSQEFMKELKEVYKASTEKVAYQNLEKLQQKWEPKYALAIRPWLAHWDNLKTFFAFPEQMRSLIYTTNAVESVHRQLRKVTKNKAVFPTDEALVKMLFLAISDISKKWTMPLHGWKTIISHLSIAYGDRLGLDI